MSRTLGNTMKHKCTNCGHVDEITAKNQVKGGKARWKGTTKKTRSAAASKAAKARWQKSENADVEASPPLTPQD